MFEKIKHYYETVVCSEQRVSNAAAKDAITAEQYQKITGSVYQK